MQLFLLFCIGVAADQLLKHWATLVLSTAPVTVIPGFFSLTYTVNRGAAWSFLAGHSWGIHVLTIVSLLAFLVLGYLVIKTTDKRLRYPLLAITSGCFGNLIDRAFYHGVVDLFSFRFGSYQFPVFNLADVLLVLGVIALILVLLFDNRSQSSQTNSQVRHG